MLATRQFNYDNDTDKVFKTQSTRFQHIPDVKNQNSLFLILVLIDERYLTNAPVD